MKVLILGATGNIGRAVRQVLLAETKYRLTLFSRHSTNLQIRSVREKAVNGDVFP